jgi:hypothetical protein
VACLDVGANRSCYCCCFKNKNVVPGVVGGMEVGIPYVTC